MTPARWEESDHRSEVSPVAPFQGDTPAALMSKRLPESLSRIGRIDRRKRSLACRTDANFFGQPELKGSATLTRSSRRFRVLAHGVK